MGTMIEDSIQKAIEALIDQNAQLAEKIMNSDSDVDHEQKKIENICFNLLMQQQPVARDLRVISAAMKMVIWNELETMQQISRKSQSCFQKNRMC